eukprot:TRINITY_DN246_c0_g2_i3.p1 TRINITY_DN246_c0_g2~~TRINITY_DN246_c0_g2_i3.p1  ORF type:complete len:361 (+),score=63.37 TRINITY_DN246_c0_g2_i3:89-1084(+)
MHVSLDRAARHTGGSFEVLCAFDINPNANVVYQLNFGLTVNHKSIENFDCDYLDSFGADTWLLSPPCQPYTLQKGAKQKDTEDPRAKSFLHLLKLFPTLKKPPTRILLENVRGFEMSETRKQLLSTMTPSYNYQEFLLSPTQFGLPNSRMRYFFLAKKKPEDFLDPSRNGSVLCFIPCCKYFDSEGRPLEGIKKIECYLEGDDPNLHSYLVPQRLLQKTSRVMDITKKSDSHSCCFTKAYGQYVEGTGSLLQQNLDIDLDSEDSKGTDIIEKLELRFFTPREIANLHGFPADFTFGSLTKKQQYQLLGNSLNCVVVGNLLQYLLQNQDSKI